MKEPTAAEYTILVAEDTYITLQLIYTQLSQAGYRVFVAENGEQALEYLAHSRVDLILLDVMMPGVDGFETAEQIKRDPKTRDIPIVFMTSLSDTHDKLHGFQLGAVDYIVKPFHPSELLARVRTHLRIKGLQQNLQKQNAELQDRIAKHLETKKALQRAHDELERRVQERTAQLSETNKKLRNEVMEHRWTSKALRESEARFRQVVISITDHIYVSRLDQDGQGVNLYISPNVQELTGYSWQKFVTNWNFWPSVVIHPEDRAIARGQRQLLAEGRSSEVEYRIVRAGGEIVYVRDSARIETKEGSTLVYGVISDISTRKHLEHRLHAIHKIGQELALLHDESAILESVFSVVDDVLDFDRASYGLVDKEQEGLQYWWLLGTGWQRGTTVSFTVEQSICARVVTRGQAVLISDTEKEPHYTSCMENWSGRSVLCVPMRVRGKVLGVLNVEGSRPNYFTLEDQLLMQTLADKAAVALENARLYSEATDRTSELKALVSASRTMTSSLDLDVVLEQTMVHASDILKAEGVAVLLYEISRNVLVFAAAASPGAHEMIGMEVPLKTSIAGWSFVNNQSVLVRDAANDPRFYRGVDQATGLSTQSILAVPLVHKEQVVGVLEAANKADEQPFNEHDLEMLEALANTAVTAIQNARLFEQLQMNREQLRHLAQQVVSAQEQERQRLSYELHDDAGQMLTALKLSLELIQSDLPPEASAASKKIDEAVNITIALTKQMRTMAKDLRPPALAVSGIKDALEDYCDEFGRRIGLKIEFRGYQIPDLGDAVTIFLYRFLQESLNNVAKHAGASQVKVSLQAVERTVVLSIQDDGVGFDSEKIFSDPTHPAGIGLIGIQERAELFDGHLEIDSKPDRGSCVTVYLPAEERL